MQERYGTRRWILGALVMMLAAWTTLGNGHGASAADATKRPDFGSKAAFKLECELMGGTFILDGLGNLECHFPSGSWIECDASGNDCWYTPPKRLEPAGPWDPYVGTIGEATADVGSTDTPAPSADGATSPAAGQGVAAPDDDQERDAGKGKSKGKGNKGKKGGKGRKK